jgi:dienelactone hydrolase
MNQDLIGYTDGSQAFDAFVARPNGSGPYPAVMVCHTWWGRDALMESKAVALAELGYIGVAADLYGVGKRGHDAASCEALMAPLVNEPALLRRRLSVSFDMLRDLPGVDRDRLGTIGYCFGGMCSILTARMGLPLRGAVSFHGLLKVGAQLETRPKGRILVLHGQDDPMVPTTDLTAFAEEMKRVDAAWTLEAYPGVHHAFTNPKACDRARGLVYDAEADRRSWTAMTRFFTDVFG